jgi:hypothetical protein
MEDIMDIIDHARKGKIRILKKTSIFIHIKMEDMK